MTEDANVGNDDDYEINVIELEGVGPGGSDIAFGDGGTLAVTTTTAGIIDSTNGAGGYDYFYEIAANNTDLAGGIASPNGYPLEFAFNDVDGGTIEATAEIDVDVVLLVEDQATCTVTGGDVED